jgi:hypothetical protein
MALIFADRIKETTTTTGTGSLTLAGAATGFKSFNSEMSNNDTCYYCIDDIAGNWEVGLGTYQATDILARTTPIKSSNSNSLVSFGAGTKNVFVTQPAFRVQYHPVGISSNTAIATTGDTDNYIIVPETGVISGVLFSGTTTLATSDTSYVTFSITNLGQDGTGTTAVLNPVDSNTTKVTGGSAITANTKRTLVLHSTTSNLNVVAGDRLLIKAAATGTLANTVTFPTYLITVQGV